MADYEFTPVKSAQRSVAGAEVLWVSPMAALDLEQVEESEEPMAVGTIEEVPVIEYSDYFPISPYQEESDSFQFDPYDNLVNTGKERLNIQTIWK